MARSGRGIAWSVLQSVHPVIGVTTYLDRARSGVWDVSASFLPEVYFRPIVEAGGIPVLLPPQESDARIAATVVGRLDGLIVTGGDDIDPARYGQERHPRTQDPNRLRDAWEGNLLEAAIASDVPFLGICRGIQMLNVTRGGSLVQHLPDVVGSDRYDRDGAAFTPNDVDVAPGSALAALIGEGAHRVKSYHHQAIDRVGAGLEVAARSDDGTIQAVELTGARFGVGVQWHPEETAEEDARLFVALVAAAREHAEAPR